MSAFGRLCCKSLFALLIANFSSCRRGFRVNMWGTSSPGDKRIGDFGNEPDAASIQRSSLVSTSGGKFVTRHFQTFGAQLGTYADFAATLAYGPKGSTRSASAGYDRHSVISVGSRLR